MLETTVSSGAAAYIEGLEGFFGVSVHAVAARLRKAIKDGPDAFHGTRFDDFLDTYCEQLVEGNQGLVVMPPDPSVLSRQLKTGDSALSTPLKGLPVLDPGETRPLLMLRVGDNSPWGQRYPAGDAKTVLLYSKEIVLMDATLAFSRYWRESSGFRPQQSSPLTRSEAARAWSRHYAGLLRAHYVPQSPTLEGLPREEWLVRAVEQYATLAEAIRKGYVESVFVDPASPWSAWRPGEEYIRVWEEQNDADRDPEAIYESMRDILLAVSVAASSPGLAHSVARPGFEEAVLHHFRSVLEGKRRRQRTLSAIPSADDRMMIGRLFELNLHGVDFTQVRDLVAVRDAELFSDVRTSMREAVVAAEHQEDQRSAQAAAREVLRDHSSRIKPRGIGKALKNAILPNTVGYALGGFAASAGAWQPLLPLVGKTVIDVARDRHQQKAIQAQRSLYIALSRTPNPNGQDLGGSSRG